MSRKNATGPHRALVLVLTRLGTLRIMLALTALVMLFAAPAPGTRPDYHGWGMIPTLIAPTLAPIVFMVDKRGTERARLKFIVFLHLLLAATLMIVWYPYFRAIM